MEPVLTVRPAPDDDPAVLGLCSRAEAELRARYGGGDDLGPGVHALRWLVAELDGEPAGVVALCAYAPGTGEVKRMYVADNARRRGVGRALLGELERAAASLGMAAVRLETGTKQPEALALYAALGYLPIPGYGYWRDSPLSRCFEKALPSVAARV